MQGAVRGGSAPLDPCTAQFHWLNHMVFCLNHVEVESHREGGWFRQPGDRQQQEMEIGPAETWFWSTNIGDLNPRLKRGNRDKRGHVTQKILQHQKEWGLKVQWRVSGGKDIGLSTSGPWVVRDTSIPQLHWGPPTLSLPTPSNAKRIHQSLEELKSAWHGWETFAEQCWKPKHWSIIIPFYWVVNRNSHNGFW